MRRDASVKDWADEEFGHCELGDVRRERRLVRMASGAAAHPAGRILDVFRTGAERQGAYDFLENDEVKLSAVAAAMTRATAMRAADHPYVFVAVDGSSLTLVDRKRTKNFGGVGATNFGARGLKVINAYAISPDGVPLGITDQQWWARTPSKHRQDHKTRALEDKETRHWISAIDASSEVCRRVCPQTRLWFQLDREADGVHTLERLVGTEHWFTVRSAHDRRLVGTKPRRLLPTLEATAPIGSYELSVTGTSGRKARRARMVLRIVTETLAMRDQASGRKVSTRVTIVQALEVGTTPRGEKPLEWRLLTNRPVSNLEEARLVVFGYAQRWRIEEFHRTWKSGACRVEECQLRDMRHVVKWATIMAAVAARIERLKVLSRAQPELSASTELNDFEIRALILMKRKHKKRTETIADDVPTIEQATRWLADLGGYTGPKVSGGPPGSITIRRGLDYILPVAHAIELLEKQGKLR